MTDEPKHPYPNRIRELRVGRGMKIEDLSKKVSITNQYLSLIETGKRNLTGKLEARIAEALSCSPQDLHHAVAKGADVSTLVSELSMLQQAARSKSHEQDATIPVFGTALEPPGSIKLTAEVVEWIARPEPLLKVKGGFATYVMSDTMSPAYNEGDLVLVRTSRPAHQGEDVLVVFAPDESRNREVMVRRLERFVQNRAVLKQWNPAETSEIEMARVSEIHPIIGVFRR